MDAEKLRSLIALITITFLIMPVFMVSYFFIYTKKKRNYLEEKKRMQEAFDQELITAELEVREQTMQTIGAELHDNIGQLLSLVSLTLKSIDTPDMSDEKVNSSIELLGKAIQEMRSLGKLLQGDQVLAMGLEKAIQQEVDWLTRSGVYEITYRHDLSIKLPESPSKDLFCFRMLQEILNNIIKHAQARQISIIVTFDGNKLLLSVADDGVGFADHELDLQGSGLSNIRKRALIVGGSADIQSHHNQGTNIAIQIPYP